MWTTILSFFKGKVFSEAGSLILPLVIILAVFVIWNSDSILTKFGFETTSSLRTKVGTLESQLEQLKEVNKKLKSDIELTEHSKTISEEVVSELCSIKEETKVKVDTVIDRRKVEAERIKETYKEVKVEKNTSEVSVKTESHTVQLPMTRSDALSHNNIKSINEAYDELFGDA